MKYVPLAALLLIFAAGPCRAQEPAEPRQPRQQRQVTAEFLAQEVRRREAPRVVASNANVQETQQRLQELLQQYPPTLGSVLSLDPTLLTNESYLATYPALAQFLAEHPEIEHNHAYFFAQYRDRDAGRRFDYNDPRLVAIREVGEVLGGVAAVIVFLTVVAAIVWIIRTVIEHRKWQRMSKTHVETHTRLMERLTSNDDLIAYMQSPAGQRFLNAAPIPVEGGRMLSAPFGRILWSVQAGVVVALLGAALIYASGRFAGNSTLSEAQLPIFVMGAAAMAIGLGFFISSFMAYELSRRLGLLHPQPPTAADAGTSHSH